MNDNLKTLHDILKSIFDFLLAYRPKTHSKLATLLVVAGVGMFSVPYIEVLINSAVNIFSEKVSNIKLVDDPSPAVAFILIVLGIGVYFAGTLLSFKNSKLSVLWKNNSLYLANDGEVPIDLYMVLYKLHQLYRKEEFQNIQQVGAYFEARLKPAEEAIILDGNNVNFTGAVHGFFANGDIHLGLKIYMHYNLAGSAKIITDKFERDLSYTNNGNFVIVKTAYHYESNKPPLEALKDYVTTIYKWCSQPVQQYRYKRSMSIAQKKLDFESLVFALYEGKIPEDKAVSHINKIIGKSRSSIKDFRDFAIARELIDHLPKDIKIKFDSL